MRFLPGNDFWKRRTKVGPDLLFSTPEKLYEACCEYFEDVHNNPMMEARLVTHQGDSQLEQVPKMRAMTKHGLCIFLGISRPTFDNYMRREEFKETALMIDDIIREQKFIGAAAEMLNPNLIVRDLGLSEKRESAISGPDGGPIQHDHVFEFIGVDENTD